MKANQINPPWMPASKEDLSKNEKFIYGLAYKALNMNPDIKVKSSLERSFEIAFGIVFILIFTLFVSLGNGNEPLTIVASVVALFSGVLLISPNWLQYSKCVYHILLVARSENVEAKKLATKFLVMATRKRSRVSLKHRPQPQSGMPKANALAFDNWKQMEDLSFDPFYKEDITNIHHQW